MVVGITRGVWWLLVQLGGLSGVVQLGGFGGYRYIWEGFIRGLLVQLGGLNSCWYNWEGSEAVVKPGRFKGCWYNQLVGGLMAVGQLGGSGGCQHN